MLRLISPVDFPSFFPGDDYSSRPLEYTRDVPKMLSENITEPSEKKKMIKSSIECCLCLAVLFSPSWLSVKALQKENFKNALIC